MDNTNQNDTNIFDAIIVGSGIGGLVTATQLASKGANVLVLERYTIPGGSSGSFHRNGYTFDVGASLFFGFGEKGYNPHQFVMNELEEEISLIRMNETFTIHLDIYKIVSMYTDRKRFWNFS